MSRLPDPPATPTGPRCSMRNSVLGTTCGRPRIHLGMAERGDVWLCGHCDMGAGAPNAGPPRLLAYLRTGDRK